MAKKATPSGGSTRKRAAAARPKARTSAAKPVRKPARKPVRAAATDRRRASGRRAGDMSASDALVKLIESPLVADLLAVGATAALAALASQRFSGTRGTRSAVKEAGKAAAAAMGRRISTEVEEIRKASQARSGGAD